MGNNINTGKIIKILGGFYYVNDDTSTVECRARGNFRNENILPLVGDYVDYRIPEIKDNLGYIEKVKKRQNYILRPPVANIDQSVIVFSVKDPNPNFILLDKFLINSVRENIVPTICINKIDLDKELALKIKKQYENSGYRMILTSNEIKETIKEFKNILANKTTVFAGPSGTGKSTLLNSINPGLNLKTGEISKKLKRGKHTTRHVEMIKIFEKTWVVDTAGFSNLDLKGIDKYTLEDYYNEFQEHSCKFRDCIHNKEPGCVIKERVNNNLISELRYKNYLKILEEINQGGRR